MRGRQEVIELLSSSSSDEASSSDPEPRQLPPRRPGESRSSSSSSEEEQKKQLKPKKRRLVRSSHGVRVANGRRRKRLTSSESESESDGSEDLVERLAQLRRTPKKAKVAAAKPYVAPTSRPRRDARADGEMRQITEGMNFYELQAQEQMMAKFQAQNRRKAQRADSPTIERKALKVRDSSEKSVERLGASNSRDLKEKLSGSDLQAQQRALKQHHLQTARKSVPLARAPKQKYDSESGEDDGSEEEKDEEWEAFTKKSAQREVLRRQETGRNVEKSHGAVKASMSNGRRKPIGKQQTARKSALPMAQLQHTTANSTLVLKTSTKRPRLSPKSTRRSSSESASEEERQSEQESEQDNEASSNEAEVELVTQPTRHHKEKKSSHIKAAPKPSGVSAHPSKNPAPSSQVQTDATQGSLRTVLHGTSEAHHLVEKMSFRELQEQERLLKMFQAQKRRNASGPASTVRKGGSSSLSTNGGNSAAKTNGSGRRARMGVGQKETADTSTSLSYVTPPARNGFLAPSAQFVSAAGCTARQEEKPTNPVIHSTAWRRLVFEEAPPNILYTVSAIPYSSGSDRPLWDYDRTGELKEKCKFVAVGQGVAITEDNFEIQPPSQSEVNIQVRELVEQELPYIKRCHARRVRHILKDTRRQLSEYLQAHQIVRSERYRRLQWSEIANHQSWLDISPIERVMAKRVMQNPAHTIRPYNSLVGDVRYFVHRDQTPLESLVYPETVTHLPDDITAIRRSFTMIGVVKNAFVEDDPILRYVPYLGDGARMEIDNDLYTETTMSKERRIAVIGEGEELNVLNPGARDDEKMEYLLRVIVGKCGASDQVFLALQHEAGFDQPRIDYCGMKDLHKAEERMARRIAKVRKLMSPQQESSANDARGDASKALCELTKPYWFLQDEAVPHSLEARLQPPLSVFESNYADSPEMLGIRSRNVYEGLVEWHRDLFCRRCYSYDCSEHGIQNPQRSVRTDPINPMVSTPGIVLARQDIPSQENDLSAEGDSPNSSVSPADHAEVIELTGSSSSDDEKEETKHEHPQPDSHPVAKYRRSRRAQTRISSLASKSLQSQEKMLETERLAEQETRRKRREKFERSADSSEYLDNSYFPAVTATLKSLLSKSQPCGPSCWLSAADKESNEGYAPLRQVDAILVRKLASTLKSSACVISAMLNSPRCTCNQIFRFLAEEKRRKDSGDNLGADTSMPAERQRKGRCKSGGVGSNRSLAKRIREQRSYDREKKLSYKPCDHDGVCDETCDCTKRGHSCNKACSCPRDCPNRFQGCKCSAGNCHTSACPCKSAGRECDPDYCLNCGASDAAVMAFHPEFKSRGSSDLNICHNVNMLRGSIQKKIGVAFSATHGWGAYALEPIRKDEFVLEYTGELITDEEAERRGAIYDRQKVSYLFGINADYVVDAARKGNKAKFANHRAKGAANLDVNITTSNGENRIGLFAREAIEVGEELFFDYGYTHDSAPKWSQHGKQQPEKPVIVDDDENEWEQWE